MATVNEQLQSASIGHAVDLQHLSNAEARKVIKLLNSVDADLRAKLIDAIERLGADSYTAKRLNAVLVSVLELNKSIYASIGEVMAESVVDIGQYEVEYQGALFTRVIPGQVLVEVQLNTVNLAQVREIALSRPFQGRLLKEWMGDLEAGRAAKIRDGIRIGMTEGQTTDQIVRRIMGTRAEGYADGLIERSRRDVDSMVRTAISHTAQGAREAYYQQNDDLVDEVRWLSTLDNKTSAPCRLRDRLVYTNDAKHAPVGHKVPWLSGPGKLHWNAVTAGSSITTDKGQVLIEDIRAGDMVLTHKGRFKPVTDVRSKLNQSGIVRSIHMESGRILRATDDHPVPVSGRGWVFVGTVKVGDALFCNPEQPTEEGGIGSVVVSDPEDRPALGDEGGVALFRSLQLAASSVNLKGDSDIGPCEVEHEVISAVLGDPAIIECESRLHYLFALADLLGQYDRHAFGQLLSGLVADVPSRHPLGRLLPEAVGILGGQGFAKDSRHVNGVVLGHSPGVGGVHVAGFLGEPGSPVVSSGLVLPSSGRDVSNYLLPLGSYGEAHSDGVSGETSICESFPALNGAKGESLLDMVIENELAVVGEWSCHDEVHSIELSDYHSMVYDLAVADDASYVCNGVVVSNCRSTSMPIIKSYEALRLSKGLPEGTRASMDGQVPQSTNYGDWIKAQSAARQDQVLGPARGKLLRDGGLNVDSFYSDKGKLLTLDQLREQDAAAFAKAGL